MDFDYDALVALAAVVREGRFDAAAKSLNVTQSAVSQRIKQLEEKVGSVLVIRGRPCVPTEAGLQLCRHIEQVTLLQHELAERMNTLAGTSDNTAATIRISVNNDSLATWFPGVIKRASDELGVRFDILPDDQDHTEQNLKSGEALAVVTAIEKPVQGCRRLSLGSMEYIAVAAPEFYEDTFKAGVSIDTIRDSACLAFDRKDTIQEQWMMIAFGETVNVSLNMVPSYEGYLACCLNGTAWGLVPSIAGLTHVQSGELIEMTPGKSVTVPLHWQASTQSSELLRRLGDMVLEEAKVHLLPDIFRPA
ncbi:MAG: LysR family transcriptional regulator ArgP [Rhodobacteraceae bacterium]|jgi:LysR family transcriptional regulator (chromosome initiation inhibitor)|nr:LysR family transcriptional regulator ArgP [Alphaproteobacteria bacterium]MBT8476883.1 LysR family transcriptional regulator ArgP [Alphaproteobacteria bacterium]NNK67499.1 LysR family transcriptional regulator ArgP [Paracoccaceae bacterium]